MPSPGLDLIWASRCTGAGGWPTMRVDRSEQRTHLELTNGLVVPVGRTYSAAVRSRSAHPTVGRLSAAAVTFAVLRKKGAPGSHRRPLLMHNAPRGACLAITSRCWLLLRSRRPHSCRVHGHVRVGRHVGVHWSSRRWRSCRWRRVLGLRFSSTFIVLSAASLLLQAETARAAPATRIRARIQNSLDYPIWSGVSPLPKSRAQ